MWKTVAAVAALTVPTVANADRIKPNFAGCGSEQALDEMMTASSTNDLRQINALLDNGFCFPIGGLEFSMVDQGFITSQVRVYAGETSALLYVPTAATR
jgi:hypothetical protein